MHDEEEEARPRPFLARYPVGPPGGSAWLIIFFFPLVCFLHYQSGPEAERARERARDNDDDVMAPPFPSLLFLFVSAPRPSFSLFPSFSSFSCPCVGSCGRITRQEGQGEGEKEKGGGGSKRKRRRKGGRYGRGSSNISK